jgi:hypothetical protein
VVTDFLDIFDENERLVLKTRLGLRFYESRVTLRVPFLRVIVQVRWFSSSIMPVASVASTRHGMLIGLDAYKKASETETGLGLRYPRVNWAVVEPSAPPMEYAETFWST